MKRFYLILLALTLLGAAMRLYGVSEQPPLMDEVLTAYSAENYVERGHFGPTMPNHPNLRNIIVYASMGAFGKGAFGLRGFSLFVGILSIPILGLLIRRITGNDAASLIAAFFLAVDPVHITFSRQAIQEVHTAFFFLLGTLLALKYGYRSGMEKRGYGLILLPLAGVSFGLGVASKAHAFFPLIVCLIYIFYRDEKEGRPLSDKTFAVLSLTLLPFAVYLATYTPWFLRGYGLTDWVFMQKAMVGKTLGFSGNPHDIMVDIKAWQWFILPLKGYGNFAYSEGKPFYTLAMGNPLVWMLVLPSAYLIYKGRTEGRWMLLALFLTSYLPMVFTNRPIWLLSSIAVTPFAYGIVGLFLERAAARFGRRLLFVYLALTLTASFLLYPGSIGKGWDYGYMRKLADRFNPHEYGILTGGKKLPPPAPQGASKEKE